MSNGASSSTADWQRLWEHAQPRLNTIRDSLNEQTPPLARITRVGKLDAELLDQELVTLLQEPIGKALALINVTLYKFSLWDSDASYGAKLQGLKYVCDRVPDGTSTGFRLPRRLLLVHGAITLLVPYLHTRLRAHALSRAWPDAPSSDRRRKAWEFLARLESLHSSLALANFVTFLWNGRYRTLTDRLLKLSLISTQRITTRDVSYEFMNRQMVWHAFTEFLLFLLPIINTRAIGRRFNKWASSLTLSAILPSPVRSACGMSTPETRTGATKTRKGKYWSLPLDQCAICYEDAATNMNLTEPTNALTSLANPTYSSTSAAPPETTQGSVDEPVLHPLNTPYITDCGHIYCYVCITGRMMRTADDVSGSGPGGTRWECLRCTEAVTSADRLEAEVADTGSDLESDGASFEYGSDEVDYSDMSGSVGEYSESVGSD